jgi:hypothetical protein
VVESPGALEPMNVRLMRLNVRLRLRRLKLLLCTTPGAYMYAITVTLDDQFAEEAKAC